VRHMLEALVIAAGICLFGGAARAAMPAGGGPGGKTKKHEPGDITKKKDKGIKKSGDYFVLEDIKIEGKVYKPEAFHVVNRKELSLRWDIEDPRFGGNFLARILSSVKRDPF